MIKGSQNNTVHIHEDNSHLVLIGHICKYLEISIMLYYMEDEHDIKK